MLKLAFVALALAVPAFAQQSLYGQCTLRAMTPDPIF